MNRNQFSSEIAQAYITLAETIRSMQMRGLINNEEKLCLQELLEEIYRGDTPELAKALHEYMSLPRTPECAEIDAIVYATMLDKQFRRGTGLTQLVEILNTLAQEKRVILSQDKSEGERPE